MLDNKENERKKLWEQSLNVMSVIAKYMTSGDLNNAMKSCRAFRQIFSANRIWIPYYQRENFAIP